MKYCKYTFVLLVIFNLNSLLKKYLLESISVWLDKNLVFAMTIKLIPEFWRNREIPEKFWKTYEQVKLDLFQIYYLFLILFLIPQFYHPEPRPTTLQSYLTYYV